MEYTTMKIDSITKKSLTFYKCDNLFDR